MSWFQVPQLSAEPQWKSATWPEQQFRPKNGSDLACHQIEHIFGRSSCHTNTSKCYRLTNCSDKTWYDIQHILAKLFQQFWFWLFFFALTSGALTNSPEIVVVLFTNRDGSNAIGVHIPDSPGKHKVGIIGWTRNTLVDCLKPMEWVMSSLDSGTKWMRPASINWFPGQPCKFKQLHQIDSNGVYTIESRMTR